MNRRLIAIFICFVAQCGIANAQTAGIGAMDLLPVSSTFFGNSTLQSAANPLNTLCSAGWHFTAAAMPYVGLAGEYTPAYLSGARSSGSFGIGATLFTDNSGKSREVSAMVATAISLDATGSLGIGLELARISPPGFAPSSAMMIHFAYRLPLGDGTEFNFLMKNANAGRFGGGGRDAVSSASFGLGHRISKYFAASAEAVVDINRKSGLRAAIACRPLQAPVIWAAVGTNPLICSFSTEITYFKGNKIAFDWLISDNIGSFAKISAFFCLESLKSIEN